MRIQRTLRRVIGIARLLERGGVYTWGDLARIFSVSRRTIRRDIDTLQSCGAQVEFGEDHDGHRLILKIDGWGPADEVAD